MNREHQPTIPKNNVFSKLYHVLFKEKRKLLASYAAMNYNTANGLTIIII